MAAEEEKYLFAEADLSDLHTCPPHKRVTDSQLVLTVAKAYIGSGCLALPYAVSQSGFLPPFFLLTMALIINLYGMMRLVDCRKALPQCHLFLDIARTALGRFGEVLIGFSTVAFQMGILIAYFILSAQNLSYVFPSISTESFMFFLLFPISLLCAIRQMKHIAPFSFAANVTIIAVLLFSVYYSFQKISIDGISKDIVPVQTKTLTLFLGEAVYVFEGIAITLPSFNTMKNQHKFSKLLIITLSSLVLFYSFYCILAYLAFGNSIDYNSITRNFGPLLQNISSLFIAFTLTVTFIVMAVPVFEIFEFTFRNYYRRSQKLGLNPSKLDFLGKRILVRGSTVLICAIVAVLCKDYINDWIALIGSTCGSVLSFIAPSLCSIVLLRKKSSKIKVFADYMVLIFGIVMLLVVTTINVINLFSK
ncbi:hypothetical protein RCL1_003750 [Eukaryota sp. TZLM3-RCL]